MMDQLSLSRDAAFADLHAWTCVLMPDALEDPLLAIRFAQQAVATDRKNFWFRRTLGATLYRAGRIDEAIEHLNRSVELEGRGGEVSMWLFLTMAHHKAGHADQARAWLDKARPWIIERIPELRVKRSEQAPSGDSQTDQPETAAVKPLEQSAVEPLVWQDRGLLKHLFLEAASAVDQVGQ
jgi:tetratricopeptide (TPR) repeat protein